MNGRFGQEDVVQSWRVKYAEVCNAMDMVGFEEQVRTKLAVMSSIGNNNAILHLQLYITSTD